MKNIKQIRESYDFITEREEAEERKLNALVRAGLYDAKKLPALKKALDKTADKTTPQEKRMLVNLLDTLLSQVLSNQQVYMKVKQNVQHDIKEATRPDYLSKADPRFNKKFPSDRDIPTVLILKRKAIRVYPDNQKVALYYSQALDKYVTIPFSDVQFAVNEQSYADLYSDKEKVKSDVYDELKKKYAKSDTKLKAHTATDILRQGKVDYSKLAKKKAMPSLSDYASRIGGPAPLAGAVGAKIHDKIKGAIGSAMRKQRLNKALALRQAKKLANEESQPIKAVNSVMNQSSSQSLVSENFQTRLRQARESREQINEGGLDVADTAAEYLVPYYGAGKKAIKGDWKGAATDAAIDTALIGAGALTGGAGYLAGKAAKAGVKAATKTAAKTGVKSAATAAAKKPGWGRRALGAARRGLGKIGAGIAGLAAGAAASGDQGAGNQSRKPSYKLDRTSGNYQFTLKPNISDPFKDRRQSADTVAVRDAQLQRRTSQAMLRENVLDTIKNMVENNVSEKVINFNEKEITINNTVAKKLYSIYESMNKNNRKKMEEMLNESAVTFNKVLTFAIRH